MSEELESISSIADEKEVNQKNASYLSIDESSLSLEKRQEATWTLIEDIQTLKSKINESKNVVNNHTQNPTSLSAQYEPQILNEIANILACKSEIDGLAGKAVVLNYGLIHFASKPYLNKGIEREDLLQDAFLLAQRAFINYDPEHYSEANYVTYVGDCIREGLHRSFDSENLVHIPEYLIPTLLEYRKAKFDNTYERTPDEVILARLYPYYYGFYLEEKNRRSGRYNVDEFLRNRPQQELAFNKRKKYIEKANNSIGIKELDAPIFRSSVSRSGEYVQKSREVTLAEELVDSGQGDRPVEDTLQDKVLIDYIDGLLEKSNLSEREAEVIRLRFGFYDGVEHTLEETSQVFNVTRERIRQLETKALTKLRHPERSKELKEYL